MKKLFDVVNWAVDTNVYEVNLRQYTTEGNLKGFEKHLDRLAKMGVEVLWFMPITPIAGKNRKGSLGSYYACSSYIKINPEFGDLNGFKSIVNAAHEKGMKVIIDWVANHTGWDHEWTSEYKDFYKVNHEGNFYDAHGWDDVIDLNYDNPEMRLEMISCMRFWIEECDIDGFRCDMAMLTPVDFWIQARFALDVSKKLFWLAELDPMDNPEYMQVFDSAYTWKWMNATKQFKDNGAHNIYPLREVLSSYQTLLNNGCFPAWFTSNHDENSWNGTEFEKYQEMAMPLAVFSCLWKGIPLIYSGQELPNHKRLAFFDKDPINWSYPPALQQFYTLLLNERKTNVSDGGMKEIQNSIEHHVLSFTRNNCYSILVFINFSPYHLSHLDFEFDGQSGEYSEIFTNQHRVFEKNKNTIALGAWGFSVWKRK